MSFTEVRYPTSIPRCQHIKVNGTQCGCPALRDRRLCFFHFKWQQSQNATLARAQRRQDGDDPVFYIPVLEDANSIQVALGEVMRMTLANEVDHKTTALLLYALRTAAQNLRRTNFNPAPGTGPHQLHATRPIRHRRQCLVRARTGSDSASRASRESGGK